MSQQSSCHSAIQIILEGELNGLSQLPETNALTHKKPTLPVPSCTHEEPGPPMPSRTQEEPEPPMPSHTQEEPEPPVPSRTHEEPIPPVPSRSQEEPKPPVPSRFTEESLEILRTSIHFEKQVNADNHRATWSGI